MSSAKCCSFRLGLNVLNVLDQEYVPIQDSHSKSSQSEMSPNLILWSNRFMVYKNYTQITQATLPALYKISNWFYENLRK